MTLFLKKEKKKTSVTSNKEKTDYKNASTNFLIWFPSFHLASSLAMILKQIQQIHHKYT